MNLFKIFKEFLRDFFQILQEANKITPLIKASQNDFDQLIEIIFHTKKFKPSQKRIEIKELMQIVNENGLSKICEIGNYKGGSLILLAQMAKDNAMLISIDINYPLSRKMFTKRLTKPGQKLYTIKGDSRNPATFQRVKKALKGGQLDLLFIDGDHAYEGVKTDYEIYSKLVRKGGFIAFHDIHPDSFMRTGVKTSSYVGGVPVFWEELKKEKLEYSEIISNKDQDGFGIGIVSKK